MILIEQNNDIIKKINIPIHQPVSLNQVLQYYHELIDVVNMYDIVMNIDTTDSELHLEIPGGHCKSGVYTEIILLWNQTSNNDYMANKLIFYKYQLYPFPFFYDKHAYFNFESLKYLVLFFRIILRYNTYSQK